MRSQPLVLAVAYLFAERNGYSVAFSQFAYEAEAVT